MNQDINVLALVKGEERYIFLYDDDRKSETLRTLGRFASDPELSFTWYDAAVLSQKIRKSQSGSSFEEATIDEGSTSERAPRFHYPDSFGDNKAA